jgi:hypothetical protein
MNWSDLWNGLLLLVPLAIAIMVFREPTSTPVKWISLGLAVATFAHATLVAHYAKATIGLGCVSLPFVVSAWATYVHWLKPRRPLPPINECLQCGYDLTGNLSGTCPECGLPVPVLEHASTKPASAGNRKWWPPLTSLVLVIVLVPSFKTPDAYHPLTGAGFIVTLPACLLACYGWITNRNSDLLWRGFLLATAVLSTMVLLANVVCVLPLE